MVLLISLVGIFSLQGQIATSSATEPFPYDNGPTTERTTDMGKIIYETNQGGSILEKYLNLFGINYADQGQGKAIVYVQVVINYVLGILGIIAVVLILYSFYSIFFSSKEDAAIENARKTVIGASIGLLIIGVSAYIVNFVFYIYNKGL